jgi:hypothetical protein
VDLITGADVLLAVLGGAAPTAAQTTRAGLVATAINAEVTTALDWPDGTGLDAFGELIPARVATAAETADLVELAKLAAADLWARRDAKFGFVPGFGGDSGAVARVGRDPIETIRPALNRRRHGAAGNFG